MIQKRNEMPFSIMQKLRVLDSKMEQQTKILDRKDLEDEHISSVNVRGKTVHF
jgi:hypothetical protein